MLRNGGTTWNLAIDNLNFDQVFIQSVVPEPGSLILLAASALLLLRRR